MIASRSGSAKLRFAVVAAAVVLCVGLLANLFFYLRVAPRWQMDGPRIRYAEGRVDSVEGVPTVDGRRLPDSAANLDAAIQSYRGLSIGLEYNNETAIVVSPIEDEWERFASVVQGIEAQRRAHLPLETMSAEARPFPDAALIQRLDGAVADVDRRYKELPVIAPADRTGALGDLVMSLKRMVNIGVQAADATSDAAQRNAAIELAKAGRAEYISGTLQNYEGATERPSRFYRSIVNQLDATAGVRIGNRLDGTAFVVAADWAVTASHVVAKVGDLATISVVFGHEEHSTGATAPGVSCKVAKLLAAEPGDGMDLSALQLSCPDGKLPANVRPLTLANRTANLDEAVYVVGHPRQSPKRIADNAFVRFPHRLTLSGVTIVRARVADTTERNALDAGYVGCEPGWWCYRSSPSRWDAGPDDQPIWPTVGFAANTYKGNSGSPLFFADDHTVAGLLFGGRADFDRLGSFSFFRHEGAVPSQVLLSWLKTKKVI